jgi:hypothetical protein
MIREAGSDYERFMSTAPSAEERAGFEHGGRDDPRILGGREFAESLPRAVRAYRTSTTLDQLIDTVACRLGLDRGNILSGSRERELTLARAVIAWHATERRIAPLSDVARRLRRDPSTLSVGITRYRCRRPDLFDVGTMHDLAPLAMPRAHSTRWNGDEANGRNDAAHS